MKKRLVLALVVLFCVPLAQARETLHKFPIKDLLESEKGKSKLSDVPLYFGEQGHPKVARTIGTFSTSKKTRAFGKSDREACEWVFLTALIQLQQRATQEGGNGVIDIKSNYKNVETVSNDEYTCGAGNVIAGVALIGTVVELEE